MYLAKNIVCGIVTDDEPNDTLINWVLDTIEDDLQALDDYITERMQQLCGDLEARGIDVRLEIDL